MLPQAPPQLNEHVGVNVNARKRMAKIDEATLYRLYVEEQQSIRSIAVTLRVAPRTVHDAMIHYRIPRRQKWRHHPATSPGGAREALDAPLLQRLYVAEQRSIREIATIMEVYPSVVYNALVRWDIPRRKRGPCQRST